jgi:hypothetical protein
MTSASPVATADHGAPTFAERASAILRDEIASGALANIAAAGQRWPTVYRDLVTAATAPRAADIGGLMGDLLELLVPARPAGPIGRDDRSSDRHRAVEPGTVLSAARAVAPGGSTAITTALQNDGPDVAEVAFVWGDLTAAPDRRIAASHLRLSPDRARIPPGASFDLAIVLDVPPEAAPGLYRVAIRTTAHLGPSALLTFPVSDTGRTGQRTPPGPGGG